MSELTKRILFAVPAAAFFLLITYLGSFYFVGLIILLTFLVQRELCLISRSAGFQADPLFPYLVGGWILSSPFISYPLIIGLAIFLGFIVLQVFTVGDRGLKSLVFTFFPAIYVPIGFLALLLIRNIGSTETGFVLTLSLLLMVWGNDVFAYLGGKTFGKKLLAPTVSPSKTWEGFFFGILGAFVGLCIALYATPFGYPVLLWLMLPAVLLVSIFGPVGDLTESRLKRAADVKDASDILPGHGGFFDRFDALLLAAPAFYVYLKCLEIMEYVSF